MKKQRSETFSNVVIAIVLLLFTVSAAVVFTLNFRPLYQWEISLQDLPGTTGLSASEIRQNYDVLIDYNSAFHTGDLELPNFPMSESGRIHFQEVKQIFVAVQILCIITLIVGAIGVFFKIKRESYAFLKIGGILALVVPAVLGRLIVLGWEQVFTAFHKIFFNNDFWIFSAVTDPVITILPSAFFMHCAILILSIVLLGGLVQLLLYRDMVRRSRRKRKSKYSLNLR